MPPSSSSRVLVPILLALCLLLSALFVAYWIAAAPRSSPTCLSYDPCVANASLAGACVTPPRRLHNGSDCTARDVCYRTVVGVRKRCNDGLCVSRREDCQGYCQADDDCAALPLRSDAFGTNVTATQFCYAESCITVVVGGNTAQCAQWISDPRLAACLWMSYSDAWGAFESGVCVYRYVCAPFDFALVTEAPTVAPTSVPTVSPTMSPTVSPTAAPSAMPTVSPTAAPTALPTVAPTAAPTTTPTPPPTPETPEPTSEMPDTEAPTAEPPGMLRLSALEFGSGSPQQIRDLRERISLMIGSQQQ